MNVSSFNLIYCENGRFLQPALNLLDIFEILQKREIDFSKLIEIVSRDQKLACRLLEFSHSSFFNSGKKVESVGDAIKVFGINNLKELVYAAICCNFFNREETVEWQHAYTTSLLVTEIAKYYSLSQNHDLQLLALLHDIGKVVLRRNCRQHYKRVWKQVLKNGMELYEEERHKFHFDHSDIGALLLDSWKLPSFITEPIFFHHMEELPPNYREETAVLKFADWVDNRSRKHFLPGPYVGDISLGVALLDDTKYWLDFQEDIISSMQDASTIHVSVA